MSLAAYASETNKDATKKGVKKKKKKRLGVIVWVDIDVMTLFAIKSC